ncbi:secreted effector protein SseD [Pseudomonas frederiksbergensis]|uniref:hypothetical protein n=1 Tax=Pseudomonas frederiksbergensis TaxID=104087 RepID=UPI003D2087C6
MTTINTQPLAVSLPAQYSGAGTSGTEGNAFTSINDIIILMKKMNTDMRDTMRGFHSDMQKMGFDKQVLAFETKQDGIDSTYKGAMAGAISQIASGGFSLLGGARGSAVASALGTGAGKASEGIGGVVAAGNSRDGQQTQVLGDFFASAAESFAKILSTAAETAAEASRQLRDVTRELVGLFERIVSALQMVLK